MIQVVIHLVIVIAVIAVVLGIAANLIWLERRLLGLFQDRYGPNRVGPFGLIQVARGHDQDILQGRLDPTLCGQARLRHRPGRIIVTVLMPLRGRPLRARHRGCQRLERGPPFLPRLVVPRRLQHSPGRLVLRTTSTRCSGRCGVSPRCSAMKFSWGCRSWAWS